MPPDYSADAEQYIKVPHSIASRRDLSFSERLLLSLIAGLCARRGHCDGSNGYLAMRLGTEASYIRDLLTGLKGRGLIGVEVDKASGNARRIFLTTPDAKTPDKTPDPMGPGQHTSEAPASDPMRSGPHTYEAIATEGMGPEPQSYDAPPPEAMWSGPQHRLKKNQSKTKEEIKAQTPQGGQTKEIQPSVLPEETKERPEAKAEERQKPLKQTASLSHAQEAHRAAWESLDAASKRPFLDAAAAELLACGLADPPARAVEPRAFHLYARASALAFIEAEREKERVAP